MSAPAAAAAHGQESLVRETLTRPSCGDGNMIDSFADCTAAMMYPQLTRQLEYYFSEQNLFKDSYLQTLRSLNDGCVPLSILANFGKVQLITTWNGVGPDETSRRRAVLQAVRRHSKLLLIYRIDAESGKVVNEATDDITSPGSRSVDSVRTILALGTRDRKPINAIFLMSPSSPTSADCIPTPQSLASTLILRDVDPQVTADDVRLLFERHIDACPKIISIRPDIGYCWFVVLNTTSREEMISIMTKLGKCTLRDNYVHARLKASAPTLLDPAAIPVIPLDVPILGRSPHVLQRKKRNRKRHQKKKTNRKNDEKNTASQPKSQGVNQNKTPPPLGVDQFPALPQDKQVEWELETMKKDNEVFPEQEESSSKSSVSKLSDAASTATTMSSSVDSCRKVPGGYAAALLKTLSTTHPIQGMNKEDRKFDRKNTDDDSDEVSYAVVKPKTQSGNPYLIKVSSTLSAQSDPCPVVVQPPAWGEGRTFADVMRSC